MASQSVSVIVPLYNCAPYVGQCIASLKSQTLDDFEAIVVDDGSSDDSLACALTAIGDDERFAVAKQDVNRGLSAARNAGLDLAKGEYVVFLDSDDYLRNDALQLLVERARSQQLDDLYFSGTSFYEDTALMSKFDEDFGKRDAYEDVATGRELFVFFVERGQFFTSAALRMVRRDFIEAEGIRFVEGLLHEDILFTFRTLVASKRSSFLNEPLYMRRWRNDSIVTRKWTWKNIDGHFTSMNVIRGWMREHAHEIEPEFAAAVGRCLGGWQHLCAERWANDLGDEERLAYVASLPDDERVEFFLETVGVGGESARIRQEFADSPSFRLGNALLAVPRTVRDQIRFHRIGQELK